MDTETSIVDTPKDAKLPRLGTISRNGRYGLVDPIIANYSKSVVPNCYAKNFSDSHYIIVLYFHYPTAVDDLVESSINLQSPSGPMARYAASQAHQTLRCRPLFEPMGST